MVMSAIFSRKGMSWQHTTRKKRAPTHSFCVSFCLDLRMIWGGNQRGRQQCQYPQRWWLQRRQGGRRRGSIPWNQSLLTTAAAASVATADDGESLGSGFDFHDDISFSGGGDMGGVENEGVEEDAGVEGAELAALTSVFDCDHINQKKMNDKDVFECGWCGKFFTPVHATRALKHVLKIKKGGINACKALTPPQYLARYRALSGYHSDRIESGKQTTHKIDLSVE